MTVKASPSIALAAAAALTGCVTTGDGSSPTTAIGQAWEDAKTSAKAQYDKLTDCGALIERVTDGAADYAGGFAANLGIGTLASKVPGGTAVAAAASGTAREVRRDATDAAKADAEAAAKQQAGCPDQGAPGATAPTAPAP